MDIFYIYEKDTGEAVLNLQCFRIISYFAEVCHKLMTLLLSIQAIKDNR